ncbi:MAG: DUF4340 domain-containing protein [Anaerolineales bacterium]|nr:DUF4340 domain-containing protein [Anaerolineales bacterium]MCZ2121215.1 DUF4340 domain-containing protein [Anaerolineales bacterium]
MAEKNTKPKSQAPKPRTPKASTPASAPKSLPKKSPIGIGTIITLVIFAALIITMVLLNQKKEAETAQATPTAGTAYVFTEADGNLTDLKIESQDGSALELTRDAKNVWGLTLPEKVAANPSAAEAAESQVKALTIIPSEIDAKDLSIFGLDAPAYTITVKFADGKSRTLEIGDSTPTNSGYYARLDKKEVMIVSLSGIDSLTQMILFPPYLNTPTPLPPTATPAPPTAAPATPQAEATATP